MARLVIVRHAPSEALARLCAAAEQGASAPELADCAGGPLDVRTVEALSGTAEDVLAADGLVLITPANFGYMSGALKHFFDSTFLQIGGALAADGSVTSSTGKLPFGLLVHGRYDVTGAVRSVQAITAALPWRAGSAVVEVIGDVSPADEQRAYELGATIAALALDL